MFVSVFPNFPPRAPLYYRTASARDVHPVQPPILQAWSARPLSVSSPPRWVGLYYWSAADIATPAAPSPDTPTWQRPITYAPLPLTLRFAGIMGGDVPPPDPGFEPTWRSLIRYRPAWPVTIDFSPNTDVPATASVTWRAQRLWQTTPPAQTRFYYQEALRTTDSAPSAPDFTSPWSARVVSTPKPPATVSLYYRQQTERDASAPTSVETTHPWRPQTIMTPRFPADLFQVIQTADVTGQDTTPEIETPQSWVPRPLSQARPYTGYMFRQDVTPDDQPIQPVLEPPWRPQVTYKPLPLTLRFDGIRGGDVPAPPTPAESTNATWFPRPLSVPKPSPAWGLAFWSPNTDQVEEPSSQFQVFWQYQTGYERLARHFLLRGLQSGSKDGVSIPEASTFPGFIPRPIRVNQVPALARLLYRQAPPMDFDRTPEQSTYPGYVPRPLWPFMAPKGAYMYYRSGLGKDEPPPLPPPTAHGNNVPMYMRRLELLGVRLGMTAV